MFNGCWNRGKPNQQRLCVVIRFFYHYGIECVCPLYERIYWFIHEVREMMHDQIYKNIVCIIQRLNEQTVINKLTQEAIDKLSEIVEKDILRDILERFIKKT